LGGARGVFVYFPRGEGGARISFRRMNKERKKKKKKKKESFVVGVDGSSNRRSSRLVHVMSEPCTV
jgi:hypothetical protein